MNKLIDFYDTYYSFPETASIVSIYSGLVGSIEINCYNANNHGITILQSYYGKTYESMKLKKKNKVLTLGSITGSIKINDETM